LCNLLGADAGQCGLLLVRNQEDFGLIILHIPVNIGNRLRGLEDAFNPSRYVQACFFIRAVDFGDQGLQHWRARRYLRHFDIGPKLSGDLLYRGSDSLGYIVALPVALVFAAPG